MRKQKFFIFFNCDDKAKGLAEIYTQACPLRTGRYVLQIPHNIEHHPPPDPTMASAI